MIRPFHIKPNDISFSRTDIRSKNFKNKILVGADFSDCHTGLSPRYTLGVFFGLTIAIIISGLVIGYSSTFPVLVTKILIDQNAVGKEILIAIGLISISSFIVVIARLGIRLILGSLCISMAVITGTVAFIGDGNSSIVAAAILQSIVLYMMIAALILQSFAFTLFLSISKIKYLFLPILLAFFMAVIGVQEGIKGGPVETLSTALFFTGAIALFLTAFSTYIGIQSKNGDRRYELLCKLSTNLCARLGTNFRGADLTDANFTGASLPHTDFRQATLKRTSWLNAKKLELSRLDNTYLADPMVRDLVINRHGEGKIYDRKDLKGLNLESAQLSGASFTGADLNESNLQGANLSKTKLVKTRLYGTNLNDATLSGAYIEDWAISLDTQLDNIKCTDIHMRLPTEEDPDPWRKPDNRKENFQPGDFTDFIAPIIKTINLYRSQNVDPRQLVNTFKSLDLYHYGGIDPAAAAIAFQQLSEDNPEAGLELVALEGRGEEKIRLQATITGKSNSSRLNQAYFEKYSKLSSLPHADIQSLLAEMAEKVDRIRFNSL